MSMLPPHPFVTMHAAVGGDEDDGEEEAEEEVEPPHPHHPPHAFEDAEDHAEDGTDLNHAEDDAGLNHAEDDADLNDATMEDFVDPAIVAMVEFARPLRPVTENADTFWGNPVIQSVLKFDGTVSGFMAGSALHRPGRSMSLQLSGDVRVLRCRLQLRDRAFFERDNGERIINLAQEGDSVLYHMRCAGMNLGMAADSDGDSNETIVRVQVFYTPPDKFPCALWHVTSLELLEVDRTGVNMCACMSRERDRAAVPFGAIVSDWHVQQYRFLNAPATMSRTRVWRLRHSRWKMLLRAGFVNKARKWAHLNPADVPDDWVCSLCLERPGIFCTYLVQLPCGHVFHPRCFCNVAPTRADAPAEIRCPICRHPHNVIDL
jgi:hypothetical protein